MIEPHDKEVRFDKYCKKCKHWELPEWKDECHYCLAEPIRTDTIVPLNFKEKDKK